MATISATNSNILSPVQNLSQYGGSKPIIPISPADTPVTKTPIPTTPTVVTPKIIGTTPVKLPTIVPTPSTNNLKIASGEALGQIQMDATYTPPVNKEKTEAQSYLKKIMGNIEGQAEAEAQIKKDEQLQEKKQRALAISNELDKLDKDFRDEVASIKENPMGKTAQGIQFDIARAQDVYENTRANKALSYRVANGDYQGAQEIANEKVNALKDQNDQAFKAYQLLVSSINNDLTESEKLQAQAQINRKENDYKSLQNAYSNALEQAVQNGAPASVLAGIDQASRKPNATEADIYSAAGQYGQDILGNEYKRAQIASANRANQPDAKLVDVNGQILVQVTPKEIQNLNTTQIAKNSVVSMADSMIASIKKYGTQTLFGEASGTRDAAKTNLLLQMKNLEKTGALDQGTIDVLSGTIPGSSFFATEAAQIAKLEQLKTTVVDKVDEFTNSYRGTTAEVDPRTKRIYETTDTLKTGSTGVLSSGIKYTIEP